MFRHINRVLLLSLILMFTVKTEAQEVVKLSVQDAVSIGLENSKSLKISNAKITIAKQRVMEINANRYPSLKFILALAMFQPLLLHYLFLGLNL